jgi:hypothetical protein
MSFWMEVSAPVETVEGSNLSSLWWISHVFYTRMHRARGSIEYLIFKRWSDSSGLRKPSM